jgi:hypothetical protein
MEVSSSSSLLSEVRDGPRQTRGGHAPGPRRSRSRVAAIAWAIVVDSSRRLAIHYPRSAVELWRAAGGLRYAKSNLGNYSSRVEYCHTPPPAHRQPAPPLTAPPFSEGHAAAGAPPESMKSPCEIQ